MLSSNRIGLRFVSRSLQAQRRPRDSILNTSWRRQPPSDTKFNAAFRRCATTQSAPAAAGSRIVNFFRGGVLLLGLGIIFVYITDTRASVHRWVVIPVLRYMYADPEEAHEVGNRSLKQLYTFGLHPRERGDPDKKGDLAVDVFGTTLRNPIGTSAGIDKHAEIPDPLFELGPAIIEIGGTTPQPQPGNEKPRVFRLTNQNALINRYGLNSEGADHVALQLKRRVRRFAETMGFGHDIDAETAVLDGAAGVPPGSLTLGKLLAVNIAKNKVTPETDIDAVTQDYLYCAGRLAPYADILVVNVSSPNTPGLRTLQTQESLTKILSGVVKAAQSVQRKTKPAVMVKVSPDEDSDEQIAGICQAIWESDVDGIIVGNTTNTRPDKLPHLRNLSPAEEQHLLEQGGFSGPHLFEKTLAMVKKYKRLLGDTPPTAPGSGSGSGSLSSTVPEPSQASSPERKPGAISALLSSEKEKSASKPESAPEKPVVDATGPIAQHSQSSDNRITNSIHSESIPLQNLSEKADSEKQPLIRLPTIKFYDQSQKEQDSFKESPDGAKISSPDDSNSPTATQPPTSSSQKPSHSPAEESSVKREVSRRDNPKVIFATGGITNGKQALDILNAGASVAMVYTALVYGGVGTISRIKDEMRQELAVKKAAEKPKRKAKPRNVDPASKEKAVV